MFYDREKSIGYNGLNVIVVLVWQLFIKSSKVSALPNKMSGIKCGTFLEDWQGRVG